MLEPLRGELRPKGFQGGLPFPYHLGGTNNVIAPFAAALLYGLIHTTAYDLSPNTWQMSLGIALLLLIVFLPQGLFGRFAWR